MSNDEQDPIHAAAAEWASARRAAMRELQAPAPNVSVSMARMAALFNVSVSVTRLAKAEAALYALFPDAQ